MLKGTSFYYNKRDTVKYKVYPKISSVYDSQLPLFYSTFSLLTFKNGFVIVACFKHVQWV